MFIHDKDDMILFTKGGAIFYLEGYRLHDDVIVSFRARYLYNLNHYYVLKVHLNHVMTFINIEHALLPKIQADIIYIGFNNYLAICEYFNIYLDDKLREDIEEYNRTIKLKLKCTDEFVNSKELMYFKSSEPVYDPMWYRKRHFE